MIFNGFRQEAALYCRSHNNYIWATQSRGKQHIFAALLNNEVCHRPGFTPATYGEPVFIRPSRWFTLAVRVTSVSFRAYHTSIRMLVNIKAAFIAYEWRQKIPQIFSHGKSHTATRVVWHHHFYAQKQLLFSARLSHRNSVRLSVRLSHGWINQKRCKMGSSNLQRQLPGRL